MTGYIITKANRDYHPWEIGCIVDGGQCGVRMCADFDDVLDQLKSDHEHREKKDAIPKV